MGLDLQARKQSAGSAWACHTTGSAGTGRPEVREWKGDPLSSYALKRMAHVAAVFSCLPFIPLTLNTSSLSPSSLRPPPPSLPPSVPTHPMLRPSRTSSSLQPSHPLSSNTNSNAPTHHVNPAVPERGIQVGRLFHQASSDSQVTIPHVSERGIRGSTSALDLLMSKPS